MDAPADAAYLGTRCCGASASTPHWAACKERLDVWDPQSYVHTTFEVLEPDPLHCDNCYREVKEGEYRDFELANDAGGVRICDDCWMRVP